MNEIPPATVKAIALSPITMIAIGFLSLLSLGVKEGIDYALVIALLVGLPTLLIGSFLIIVQVAFCEALLSIAKIKKNIFTYSLLSFITAFCLFAILFCLEHGIIENFGSAFGWGVSGLIWMLTFCRLQKKFTISSRSYQHRDYPPRCNNLLRSRKE